MWIAREITVKTAGNFHFKTRNSLKWMILRVQAKKLYFILLTPVFSDSTLTQREIQERMHLTSTYLCH